MEKKTKYRILGAVLIIALIIILLPLFESGKELSTEKITINVPPFPDQTVQVPSSSAATEVTSNQESTSNQSTTSAAPAPNSAQTDNDLKQAPEDLLSTVRPNIVSSQNIVDNAYNAKQDDVDTNHATSKNKSITNKKDKVNKINNSSKQSHRVKSQFVASLATNNKETLAKLKNSAWVVQIGSFKNKENAFRLVNQLRSNGYSAFIQQRKTAFGENTRVFVGPESKQALAQALASQLENEMHIRGIVISYKPLTL